jgi:hypothetical protein
MADSAPALPTHALQPWPSEREAPIGGKVIIQRVLKTREIARTIVLRNQWDRELNKVKYLSAIEHSHNPRDVKPMADDLHAFCHVHGFWANEELGDVLMLARGFRMTWPLVTAPFALGLLAVSVRGLT